MLKAKKGDDFALLIVFKAKIEIVCHISVFDIIELLQEIERDPAITKVPGFSGCYLLQRI
jgi:hypothetical protein